MVLVADRIGAERESGMSGTINIDSVDAAWLAAVVLNVAGALLHPLDRRLTLSLSVLGLAVLAAAAARGRRAPRRMYSR